jgi:hypothetical protein
LRQIILTLTEAQRQELVSLRDRGEPAYLRERCAALLKVADGAPGAHVARDRLLRPRKGETVCGWVKRFREEGVPGLLMRPGRGRKRAFSP